MSESTFGSWWLMARRCVGALAGYKQCNGEPLSGLGVHLGMEATLVASIEETPATPLASTSDAKDAVGCDVDRHPMWKTCP